MTRYSGAGSLTAPIYDKAEKNKTCCLAPWIFIFDGCKDVYFDEDFSYNGSSCIDLNTVYVRAGDNLYTYECDPDYTDYAYDTDKRSLVGPLQF